MPVPAGEGLPGPLQTFLRDLERRVMALEGPEGFQRLFAIASSQLTTANAAANPNSLAFATDLKVTVGSDGVHWYRGDTGAVIV
jgi:hypothetical protein